VDRPGTHLNPQANVHNDPIVRSSKSSLSGEVVAEEANMRMRDVSSAPNKVVDDRVMATTAANSESEQGDQLHERAVRYRSIRHSVFPRNDVPFWGFVHRPMPPYLGVKCSQNPILERV